MWYKLNIEADGDTWLVTSDDFPELTTFGDTQENACRNGLNAIEEAIAARIYSNVDIPFPLEEPDGNGRFVEIPAMVFLKQSLYMCLRDLDISRAELQRRMGVKSRETIDRLFRLDHNTRLDGIEKAFKAIDIPLSISIKAPNIKAA